MTSTCDADERDNQYPEAGPVAGRWTPARCASVGHEQLPAAAVGIYDDGEQATADVPYCAECARILIAAKEFRITEVLDRDALGTTVCAQCGGAGRLPRPSGPGNEYRPPLEAQPSLGSLRAVLASLDRVPAGERGQGYYEAAFASLRRAVSAVLAGSG